MADSAAQVADGSGKVVSRVVDTMTRIDAQACQMAEIISVIDGIAFQTNILARNAAEEAARAGEQGRGAAVASQSMREQAHALAGLTDTFRLGSAGGVPAEWGIRGRHCRRRKVVGSLTKGRAEHGPFGKPLGADSFKDYYNVYL